MNTVEQVDSRTDEALFASYLIGDYRAFQIIHDRYRTSLWAFVWGYINNHDVCEDIVQDVFMKLHVNRDKFDMKTLLKPWLFKIAANVSIDWLRHIGRNKCKMSYHASPIIGDDGDFVEVVEDAQTPVDVLVQAEQHEQVTSVIGSLDQCDQEMLLRYYFVGDSAKDMAAEKGVPYGTIRSRLHRAVELFSEAWGQNSEPLKAAA